MTDEENRDITRQFGRLKKELEILAYRMTTLEEGQKEMREEILGLLVGLISPRGGPRATLITLAPVIVSIFGILFGGYVTLKAAGVK